MSFFKKLIGNQEKSPELQAQKQLEKQQMKDQKKRQTEHENARKKFLQEKYLGTGFGKGFEFSLYKGTIEYFENYVLGSGENFLYSITAEYDKTSKREIKGLLIATDQRLVFVSSGVGYGQFLEEFDYRKMNGISQMNDGLFEKELYIDLGRSRKKFDDIIPDERFKQFLKIVMEQINEARNRPKPSSRRNTNSQSVKTSNESVKDKYESLEKLAKLKDQGILTEDEFNSEKTKILNS